MFVFQFVNHSEPLFEVVPCERLVCERAANTVFAEPGACDAQFAEYVECRRGYIPIAFQFNDGNPLQGIAAVAFEVVKP